MSEWEDAARIAFGLGIAAFVMALTAYYMGIGNRIRINLATQNESVESDWRVWDAYDRKIVYARDVENLIREYGSDIQVKVSTGGTVRWTWGVSGSQSTYDKLDVNKMYQGTVNRDANGSVESVIFKQGKVNNSGDFVSD